jgi:antitoxin component YwqK of YwqJK toxin-antitoxin module
MTRRKPKNGLHTRYYDNGQQLSEEHYNDGKLEGKWTFWYENGQIQLKGNFKPYEVLAEDCRAERSSPYVFPARDSKDGKWTKWYENGQIMEEQYYKNGKLQDWKITTIRKLSD